jgi:hypothetical protein
MHTIPDNIIISDKENIQVSTKCISSSSSDFDIGQGFAENYEKFHYRSDKEKKKLLFHLPQPQNISSPCRKFTSFLKPGAKFSGYQESGRQQYQVQIKIIETDLSKSTLSGFLTIHGLTEANPIITTFFRGEIIGPHYSFETKHENWGSDLKNDIQHWARFPSWRALDLNINDNLELRKYYKYKCQALNNEYIFMRWKELFLYPDSQITNVKGASFAGFYYVCLNQITGNITGLYFHKFTDKFQQLNISFVADSGICPIYEYE